jgi:exodeoxyribonuclease VII small subunit
MAELEGVVARLEQGDVPLEEALKAFERGVALTRACQEALAVAEQKVEILIERPDGSHAAAPFDAAPDEDDPA